MTNGVAAGEAAAVQGNITKGSRKGTWRLRVGAGTDPVTGRYRVVARTVEARTKTEAAGKLAELVREVRAGQHLTTDATVAHLLAAWLDHMEGERSPTTVYTYRGYVRRNILPAIGAVRLRDLTAKHLDDCYADLRAAGMSPTSVHQIHAICHRALEQAVDWEWLARNPARRAHPPAAKRKTPTPPTPAALAGLIRAAFDSDRIFGTLLTVAAVTGARRGELCALRWPDVDLAKGEVTIGRALIDIPGTLAEKGTKTHSVRTIAIPAALVALLADHRARLAAQAGEAGVELDPTGFVFPAHGRTATVTGRTPWRPDQVTGAFRRLCRSLGITAHLHEIRHAAATQMLAGGVDVRTAAGRLGHASPSTTLQVYSHWVPAADRAAGDLLGGLLALPDGEEPENSGAGRLTTTDNGVS